MKSLPFLEIAYFEGFSKCSIGFTSSWQIVLKLVKPIESEFAISLFVLFSDGVIVILYN